MPTKALYDRDNEARALGLQKFLDNVVSEGVLTQIKDVGHKLKEDAVQLIQHLLALGTLELGGVRTTGGELRESCLLGTAVVIGGTTLGEYRPNGSECLCNHCL